MAFVKTVKAILLGLGNAVTWVQRTSVATNVGTVTITLPASGSFAPTMSCGKIRIKTESIVAGGTVQIGAITGTDGSTTVQLYAAEAAAGAANALQERVIEFLTDLNLTSITVTIIAGTQNSVHSVEVAGNS